MARPQKLVLPSQPFVANRTFFRAAVRFHDRLFTLAVVALCLAGYAAGGTPSMPGPSRPLFSRPLRSFIIVFLGAAPRDPGVYPGSGMGCEYPCEGTAGRSGLTPSAGPAVRRYGQTALIKAAYNDDHRIVAALLGARAAVDIRNSNGCAFAVGAVRRGGRRWPMVTPMQPCPPRPAGPRRCTMRRPAVASAPARSCSPAAPISASRTVTGNAVPPTSHADGRTPDRV
jgi:hypothetical protein